MNYQDLTVSEEIDGITYTSTKLGTIKQLGLIGRVVSMLGEAGLRAVISFSPLKDSIPSLAQSAGEGRVLYAVEQLAAGLAADLTLPLDLCANVKCNKLRPVGEGSLASPSTFDAHFSGELPHLIKVLLFVIQHNFMGFSIGSP